MDYFQLSFTTRTREKTLQIYLIAIAKKYPSPFFSSQLFSKNEVIEKDCNVRNRKRKKKEKILKTLH